MAKQSAKAMGKRRAPNGPSSSKPAAKKSKQSKQSSKGQLDDDTKPKKKDQPKKIKLRDQKVIPVPRTAFADGESDEDMDDLGEDEGLDLDDAGAFLSGMDTNGLKRSFKEGRRLHELEKTREQMPQKPRTKIRMPSVSDHSTDYDMASDADFDSQLEESLDESDINFGSDLNDDEEEEDESLGEGSGSAEESFDEDDLNSAYDEMDDDGTHEKRKRKQGDNEAEYERGGRNRWAPEPAKPEEDSVEVGRLPIKLPSGEVQMVEGSTRIALPPKKKVQKPQSESEEDDEEDEEEDEGSDDGAQAERMAGQKGRFGRMTVAEIVGAEGWKSAKRLDAAKEQMAAIGAEILGGGELVDVAPMLTRLSTYSLVSVPGLEAGQGMLPVPNSIRGLACLSQLAVYKDLVPGYRIRPLTEAEEVEKVRDEVKRLREGEKMLVRSYKGYLKTLEAEVNGRTPLASLCLRCMCDLLSSVPHFNFSENLMGVLVGRLARRSWEEDSNMVLDTFITVFRADISAIHSQTLVRLVARMIKERRFQVHPNVLMCLLHLRLRGELESMKEGKNKQSKGDESKVEKKFKSEMRKKWQTKNQKKKEKDMKEVKKEMAEAEAEVDKEERAGIQTETLKNLFVLYFSILKSPNRTPLLAAALEGISQFAHFINVDFFRDLLAVLRRIIVDQSKDQEVDINTDSLDASQRVRLRLLAIVTAFDVLSGQGSSLNIDLSDFIDCLYTLLRPLSLDTGIEDPPLITNSLTTPAPAKASTRPTHTNSKPSPKLPVSHLPTSALLFKSLHAIFFSRHISSSNPPWRTAAFAKRLLESALFFPASTSKAAVAFVRQLVAKEPKLEAMLDSEERLFNGVYKAEMEDPQLVNAFTTSFYEVDVLEGKYWDRDVRKESAKLREGKVI